MLFNGTYISIFTYCGVISYIMKQNDGSYTTGLHYPNY